MTRVFKRRYRPGMTEVPFTMDDIRREIALLTQSRPDYREKNVADVRYQYASGRRPLPKAVDQLGPWIIVGRGKAKYAFVRLAESPEVRLPEDLATIFIPDSTPEIVMEYAGGDEQGILAKIHYNRLLDVFTSLTCYHLQNHWRTSIKDRGQVEIDDLYVALDTRGRQYVIPVEAKSAKDHLNKTQITQMIEFAQACYPKLIVRPVGVQEMKDGSLALAEFTPATHPDEIKIAEMRRYKLVPMAEVPLKAQQQPTP